jgi:hypothetical protein
MLRKPLAACLVALALAVVPAMAQTPAPGPTAPGVAVGGGSAPAQATAPGAPSAQGTVVGTPKSPESTDAQSGASLVPVAYLGLIALGAAGAFWYVWRRRRGRG